MELAVVALSLVSAVISVVALMLSWKTLELVIDRSSPTQKASGYFAQVEKGSMSVADTTRQPNAGCEADPAEIVVQTIAPRLQDPPQIRGGFGTRRKH